MSIKKLNDTGHRVKGSNGAVRERAYGKGRFDGISPIALERLALHIEQGGIKYVDFRNWERGLPLSWYWDAISRHQAQFMLGDRSEDHEAAIMWNIMAFIHTREMIQLKKLPNRLNDLPNYGIKSLTISPEPRGINTGTSKKGRQRK